MPRLFMTAYLLLSRTASANPPNSNVRRSITVATSAARSSDGKTLACLIFHLTVDSNVAVASWTVQLHRYEPQVSYAVKSHQLRSNNKCKPQDAPSIAVRGDGRSLTSTGERFGIKTSKRRTSREGPGLAVSPGRPAYARVSRLQGTDGQALPAITR